MKTKLLKYFTYSFLALACVSSPLSAKDHTIRTNSLVKDLLLQRMQLKSSINDASQEELSINKKGSYSYSVDHKKRLVTVKNNKEKITVKFPYQSDAEIEAEIEDEELWVDYGDEPWHSFNAELWLKGKFNINDVVSEIIAACDEYGLEYSYQNKKKYTYVDITIYTASGDIEDKLSFDLENDSEEEDEEADNNSVVLDKIRIIITGKNVFWLFTECESDHDVKLHEQFINSVKIK